MQFFMTLRVTRPLFYNGNDVTVRDGHYFTRLGADSDSYVELVREAFDKFDDTILDVQMWQAHPALAVPANIVMRYMLTSEGIRCLGRWRMDDRKPVDFEVMNEVLAAPECVSN